MSRPQPTSSLKNGQAKTMRIRAFPTAVDDAHINSLWEGLKKAIQEIQRKNNSGLSFEELYRNAYTMVLHKHADRLYAGLQELIVDHLQANIRESIIESINGRFLETLNRAWSEHTTAMVMIRDILMYMDRVYVASARVEPVYQLGLRLFRDQIVDHPTINEHLKATLLGMIALERQKEIIEWIDLKNACQMLIALGLESRIYYEQQFEELFLRESAEFYRHASQKFLAENSAGVYVRKVNDCLAEERERAERYLDGITEEKIVNVLNEELISRNMLTIVEMENSGLVFMLLNDRIEGMHGLYELLKRVPTGSKTMIETMSKFLREKGRAMVMDGAAPGDSAAKPPTEPQRDDVPSSSAAAAAAAATANAPNPIAYVQNLINLKDQFDRYLAEAFRSDKDFEQRIQCDFEFFLNLNNKSAEYLSLYIDDKLRKGLKTLTDVEVETVLDKALILFKYLQDKDVFEVFYKQHLAKRLLLGKSSSEDAEKSMISKLKTECGCQFTSKLEGMFRDMETSNSVMNEFRDSIDGSQGDIDISVRVLTQVHWPMSQSPPVCNLPPSVEAAFRQFRDFYLGKHNGRKIQLNPSLGSADVKAIFYGSGTNSTTDDLSSQQESDQPGGSLTTSNKRVTRKEEQKILTVSTYQMCVLMSFNQNAKMTFQKLLDETQIPEKDLKRALQSLAMGKQSQRILCRKGAGKEIEAPDEFSVNDAFSSKLTRIKILPVSTGKNGGSADTERDSERTETRNKVDDDRKHEIEAAIVRVMKARKRSMHNDLVTEVTNQLKARFMPDPQLIKKRIESLIEREYLERDKYNQKQYNYLA